MYVFTTFKSVNMLVVVDAFLLTTKPFVAFPIHREGSTDKLLDYRAIFSLRYEPKTLDKVMLQKLLRRLTISEINGFFH